MATLILARDYALIEARLRSIFPKWDGKQRFSVVGVCNAAGVWNYGERARWETDARQFTEHVMCFGYAQYCLVFGQTMPTNVASAELLSALPEPEVDLLATLREVSAEITRLNKAAGETVFNPAVTQMVRAAIIHLVPGE